MCFVEHEQQPLFRIGLEERPRPLEYRALDRPQQHIFEHGVVGDQQVGRLILHLMTQQQFGIFGTLDGALKLLIRPDPTLPAAEPFGHAVLTIGVGRLGGPTPKGA